MSAAVIYRFGRVPFTAIGGIAPQKVDVALAWTWAEVPRIGMTPALQRTGFESPKYTFTGAIYSDFGDGEDELLQLVAASSIGGPAPLSRGQDYLGLFVVEAIGLNSGLLNPDGTPRSSTFSITMKQYVA